MSDILEVKNRLPGFEYRWLRNNELNIIQLEAEGWEVCEGTEKQLAGDLILAKIPQKLYDKKQAWKKLKPKLADNYAISHISRVIAAHPDLEKVDAIEFVAKDE